MASVQLWNVTVAYPAPTSAAQKSAFAAAAHAASFGRLARDVHGLRYVVALQDVSLTFSEGARVGLIGRNGSGKSTLLRTIAGIVMPRSGAREVNGSLGCVLSPHTGMNPDKTGLQNMQMMARLHGLRGEAMRRAINDAAEFTELGPFLSMPIRTYSAGMGARLAFAMATAESSDILLIDEVIGAGDALFIDKAIERAKRLCENSGIAVVASHDFNVLSGFCNEAIWLDSGKVRARGPVQDVWAEYTSGGDAVAGSERRREPEHVG